MVAGLFTSLIGFLIPAPTTSQQCNVCQHIVKIIKENTAVCKGLLLHTSL